MNQPKPLILHAAHLPDHPFSRSGSVGVPAIASATWAGVDAHPLRVPGRALPPAEPGRVRFGWCDAGLLARFEFVDSNVRTAASADNQPHYELGDTAEWFLKPPGGTHYWEFYATPNGFRAAMVWEGRGPREASPWLSPEGVRAAASTGRDGWTVDLLVPGPLLASRGDAWGPGTAWATLAARYNHGPGGEDAAEKTCFPPLPVLDFHRTHDFAPLVLAPAGGPPRPA